MSATDILFSAAGSEELFTYSTFTRIVSGSGTLNPPVGAKAMRVAVIGGGGGSGKNILGYGGGGGGCAATKIVPSEPISYSIGAGGTGGTTAGALGGNGGNTTASFGAYSLVGGGGFGGSSMAGGAGTGGDYNYIGGNGASSTYGAGGGAAGPFGNGVSSSTNSAPSAPVFGANGWGSSGGGGNRTDNSATATGGGGTGAGSGASSAWASDGYSPNPVWGKSPPSSARDVGGEMGGGAGYLSGSDAQGKQGGSGGMVVEWFY